jgi:hypothetical protein
VADRILDRLVQLSVRLIESIGLEDWVPPKLVVAAGGDDAAVGAADEDDGLDAGAFDWG